MYKQRYQLTIEGISPLLMHWDNIEWADQLKLKRDDIKKNDKKNFAAGDDRCPPETWKGYTYNDGTHVAMPQDSLRACLMKAGARVILSGKTSYKSLTQSGILFDDEFLAFQHSGKPLAWSDIQAIEGNFVAQTEGAKKLGFRLFIKRAKVNQAKHVRVRPRFDTWGISGTFLVVDKQLTTETLQQIWDIAGPYIGLCDWRPGSPQSPGPYGRFKATIQAE